MEVVLVMSGHIYNKSNILFKDEVYTIIEKIVRKIASNYP
jgi:hypothetical protein